MDTSRETSKAQGLSQEFLQDHQAFKTKFDELSQDPFQGYQLEQLSKGFLAKHLNYMNQFLPSKHKSPTYITCFPQSKMYDILEEDLRLVCKSLEEDSGEQEEPDKSQKTAETNDRILAGVFRRACQARHLRVTYNKSRHQLEEDREEAVNYGRRALRHSPNEFLVCYWFMIAVGWRLDATSGAKERSLWAHLFRSITLRCIRLNECDPLAHHLLGRYYYQVAQLSWLERSVANKLLAGSGSGARKLEGSFRDSEREFLRAHQLRSEPWLPNGLWMARCLMSQGRPKGEISDWIELGLSLTCEEPSSELERVELIELGSKFGSCPN